MNALISNYEKTGVLKYCEDFESIRKGTKQRPEPFAQPDPISWPFINSLCQLSPQIGLQHMRNEMAHRLPPHDLEMPHALVYPLSLQERYAEIVTLLRDWPKPTLADSTTEQIDIVYAEALSFAKSSLEAFTYLDMRYAEGYRSDDIDAALSALKFAETA